MSSNDYDIVIIGGGLVGASLGVALAHTSLRIAIIEKHQVTDDRHPSFDDRTVALAYGSRLIFENTSIWSLLEKFCTPIEKILISDQGQFGVTRLEAEQEKVPSLGYVVANRDLGRVLYDRLKQQENLTLFCPAKLNQYALNVEGVTISLSENEVERQINAKLLVAADGIDSQVRTLANIKLTKKQYGQSALIFNLISEHSHENKAYERFTPSGPLAFLPFSGSDNSDFNHRFSVVWTLQTHQVDEINNLPDREFLGELQKVFGFRQGRLLEVGQRFCYPLSLAQANRNIGDRTVLIGNAAHTLHPVAGQGFNLGLRDAVTLASLIESNTQLMVQRDGSLWHDVLTHYEKERLSDHRNVIRLTDGLARFFTYESSIIKHFRGLGLCVTDLLPSLKNKIARQAMGISAPIPRMLSSN